MLYARDRWHEAQYFLDLLRESKGEQPSFRYLLSALISALRSIGLVLQSDLASRSEGFNDWWEAAKSRISEDLIPFEVIRETRNELQKRGNRLPVRMRHEYESGPLLSSDVMMSLAMENGESFRVELTPRPASFPSLQVPQDGTAAEIKLATQEHMAARMSDLMARFSTVPPAARSMQSFWLLGSDQELSFTELVDAIQDHLASWDPVLSDAEARFGSL